MKVFGIDLGTTNSLIGSGDTMYSDLVSSSVDIENRTQVERNAVGENIISSYKTSMSVGEDGRLPIECSAVILKELANKASARAGEEVKNVVISVPAYFTTTQREAVYKAAEIANLKVECLINEPTAAALCVCKDYKDLIVVYDLGGGTFDITIIDARMGNYSVVATDGCVLGGDDLDEALLNHVVTGAKIPLRFRSEKNKKRMRPMIRDAKEKIQILQNTVYIDFTEFGAAKEFALTVEDYKQIVKDIFWSTVVKTKYLLHAHIPECESPKMIFVGGSTNCPYLKEMVLDEVGLEEVYSTDIPDVIVAKGVALYAKMVEEGIAFELVDDVTKRLSIEDSMGSTLTVIDSNSILPTRGTIVVSNSDKDDRLRLKLYQGDNLLAVKNDYIGTLVYQYDEVKEIGEGHVVVTVDVMRDGIVKLKAHQLLYGEASEQEVKLTAR